MMTTTQLRGSSFLLAARALLACALACGVALGVAPRAGADEIRVKPYDDLTKLARTAKPGDTVHLYPGAFPASVIQGVRGEPGRPITFRNVPSVRFPAEFNARNAPYGLRLVDCAHVRLENIAISDANGTGLLIEGESAPTVDISLDQIRVSRGTESADYCGIVVRNASQVRATRLSVGGWGAAAIRITRTDDATFETLQFVAQPGLANRHCVEVLDGSSRVSISRAWMRNSLGSAFAVGTAPGARVAGCEISSIRADGCHGLLDIGSVGGLRVRECTSKDTKGHLWAVSARAGEAPAEGSIESCVFTWTPGEVTALTPVADGASASGIALDGVLVWSRELAAGATNLGEIAGTARTPVVRDLDPLLDEAGYATEPRAAKLGLQRTRPKGAAAPAEPAPPPPGIAK